MHERHRLRLWFKFFAIDNYFLTNTYFFIHFIWRKNCNLIHKMIGNYILHIHILCVFLVKNDDDYLCIVWVIALIQFVLLGRLLDFTVSSMFLWHMLRMVQKATQGFPIVYIVWVMALIQLVLLSRLPNVKFSYFSWAHVPCGLEGNPWIYYSLCPEIGDALEMCPSAIFLQSMT